MTRDEAVEKIDPIMRDPKLTPAQRCVDVFCKLGMLKLDEPKNLPQRMRDFIMDSRLAQGDAMTRLGQLYDVLEECGLKIVEAK